MVITIFGKTGTGKTTLTKKLGERIANKKGCNFYFWSPYTNDQPSSDFCIRTNSVVGISEFHVFWMYHRKIILPLITGHRHYNIDFILDSQRPALVPRIITAVSEHILCFRITEPIDLKYLSYFIDTKQLDIVKNLNNYNYIKIL